MMTSIDNETTNLPPQNQQTIKKFRRRMIITIASLTAFYAIIAYFFVFKDTLKDQGIPIVNDKTIRTTDTLCYIEHCFVIETAISEAKRRQGLMNIDQLPDNYGMLFIFEQSKKHSFRMKNTLIPLDIFWLDTDLRIVDMKTMIPCTQGVCPSYQPSREARYVLELASGAIQAYQIKTGTTFSLTSTTGG